MGNFVVNMINKIIAGIGALLTWLIDLLPNSPFNWSYNIDQAWVNNICWLIPFPTMIAHLEAVATAIAVFYGIRIALRWVKIAKG